MFSFVRFYVTGLLDRFDRQNLFLLAGGLAFSIILCIIPLVLLMVSVAGRFLDDARALEAIGRLIERTIPYPDYAALINEMIRERVTEFSAHREEATAIGIVVLLASSSGLFSSLRSVLNVIFHCPPTRFFLLGKLKDFALVLILVLLFLVVSMATMLLPVFHTILARWEWLAQIVGEGERSLLVEIISQLATIILFFFVYLLIPTGRVGRRTALVAALWGWFLWLIARLGLSWYVGSGASLGEIYGVYLFIVVASLWVYYAALGLITAATLAQLSRERANSQK